MNSVEARKWYLERINVPHNKMATYLKAMDKYDNEWWESKDPTVIVRFQMNEPLLMVPFIKLQNALESLLGPERLAKAGSISFANKNLKKMAFAAIAEKA